MGEPSCKPQSKYSIPARIAVRTPLRTASPVPSSTRKNWSSLWTSAPISSLGFKRHHDELAVLCRVKHPAKLVIPDGETLDILYKAFHNNSLFRFAPRGR